MTTKSKKGFTIIEVVLVLAIAGLIFLMVFIALPNMQRSQRDTQRRNDYSALSANMTSYITNNNGKLPGAGSLEPEKYINEDGEDPNGFDYVLNVKQCDTSEGKTNCGITLSAATREEASVVYVVTKAICNEGSPVASNSSRAFAIYGNLEAGNGTYCQSNS